jgi:hypothetical protein
LPAAVLRCLCGRLARLVLITAEQAGQDIVDVLAPELVTSPLESSGKTLLPPGEPFQRAWIHHAAPATRKAAHAAPEAATAKSAAPAPEHSGHHPEKPAPPTSPAAQHAARCRQHGQLSQLRRQTQTAKQLL